MRLTLILVLAAASPAAAQVLTPQHDALRFEQEQMQRRMIDQQNQLMAAEARARADQAALQQQLQRDLPVRVPELRYDADFIGGACLPRHVRRGAGGLEPQGPGGRAQPPLTERGGLAVILSAGPT